MIGRGQTDDRARLDALRRAIRIGIADIESGRFRTFDSPAALKRHLVALTDSAISEKPAKSGSP